LFCCSESREEKEEEEEEGGKAEPRGPHFIPDQGGWGNLLLMIIFTDGAK
jgi:hypothetical protein